MNQDQSKNDSRRRLLIVQPAPCSPSETFLRAHAERLPAQVNVAFGMRCVIDGRPSIHDTLVARGYRKAIRLIRGQSYCEEGTNNLLRTIGRLRPDAVLAEYGETGAFVSDACERARVPFVVHFHGYDASIRQLLIDMKDEYRRMFDRASAIVAVSHAMRRRLIEIGAPAEKVHWNPCGVEVTNFHGADPAISPPVFLAVGRFIPKKAPHLTLKAFAEVYRVMPESRLRMIGFGPLEDECKALSKKLCLDDAVQFLGRCPESVVQAEMRTARCFVQHSVEAPDGDSEGAPVSIFEASASGLPVVATRHAGIPDSVTDGKTGFLVDEHDVAAMSERMLRLGRDPALAARMGSAGQDLIRREFSMDHRIAALWKIIDDTIDSSASSPSDLRIAAGIETFVSLSH